MNERFVARILQAATLIDPNSDRDAALIGAVVRTVTRYGHWSPTLAGHEARSYGQRMGVDMGDITYRDIAPIAVRFNAALQFVDL